MLAKEGFDRAVVWTKTLGSGQILQIGYIAFFGIILNFLAYFLLVF